jgi:hypothetical protein
LQFYEFLDNKNQFSNIFKMKKINSYILLLIILFISNSAFSQEKQTISSKPFVLRVPKRQNAVPLIKEEVRYHVEVKEQLIQDQLEAYLDKLLKNKQISENLFATVNVNITNDAAPNGTIEQNLHAKYSVEILSNLKDGIKSQIDDYPSGKYKLGSSNAAMSTMQILKQTIENSLAEFLVKGIKVTIKITGTTDASPIKSAIPYLNDFGSIEDFTYFKNNQVSSISVNAKDGITSNEQLGLLRTFGVRQFMETYIEPLKVTQNSFEHIVETSNEIGGKNRRVTIELVIHEALKNYKANADELAMVNAKNANALEINNSDVDVNIPQNNVSNDNTYALIIGNEDYSSQQTGLNTEVNVDFAIHDAEIFKEYCIKTLGLKNEHIFFYKNATTGKMQQGIKQIERVSAALKENVNIIVYYSGHGLPDEQTKEGYLVPVDVSGNDVTSGIKISELYKRLTANSPSKVTVFLDACFSGAGRNKGLLSLKGVTVRAKDEVLGGNLVVFSSSSGVESSAVYKDKCHGIFTYYLLKKIQETKGDITYEQLYKYVNEQVKLQSILINGKDQTPTILGSGAVINKWENWKLKE